MAIRVLPFVATIPAGTPKTAPVTVPLAFDNWTIERIDFEVPAGPAGLMGFQIYNNGVAFIPYGSGEWIVWNGEKDTYYLTDQPNASGWAVVGYNTGTYPHSVTVRFHVSVPAAAASSPPPPQVTIVTSDTPPIEPVTL